MLCAYDFNHIVMPDEQPHGTHILGYTEPRDATPRLSGAYTPSRDWPLLRDVLLWLTHPMSNDGVDSVPPLFIYGPSGVGKSSAVRWAANRINYPLYEINGTRQTEMRDLVGGLVPEPGGGFKFQPEALTQAMINGGILLINEVDYIPANVLAGLNTLLDGAPLRIEGGGVIKPDPMFRLVVTANTNGAGDETGDYVGTEILNFAFRDRFRFVLAERPSNALRLTTVMRKITKIGANLAPPAQIPIAAYKEYSPKLLRKESCEAIIKFQGEINEAYDARKISGDITERAVLQYVRLLMDVRGIGLMDGHSPEHYAFLRSMAYKLDSVAQAAVDEVFRNCFMQSANPLPASN